MAKLARLIVTGITLAASPAFAQEAQKIPPAKVVTKTLIASTAQKECFSLTNRQRLYYRYRADGPLDFKLSHQTDAEVVDVRRDRADSAAGSFVPKNSADYCLVWTNSGRQAVTLRYEFQRGPQ